MDNEAFLAAVRAGASDRAGELLSRDKVSEATLDQGLALLAATEAAEAGTEAPRMEDFLPRPPLSMEALSLSEGRACRSALAEEIKLKLLETQQAQALFEQRFFAPTVPGSTARSQFQIERGVDAQLLAPDLQPYLDSDKLSKRLSELLTNHIRDRWAPQMRSKVERASKEVEARLKQCGVPPPTAEADVPAIASQ